MGQSNSANKIQQQPASEPSVRPPIPLPVLNSQCPVVKLNLDSIESVNGLFSTLPREIIFEILKQIEDKDTLNLSVVCKFFYQHLSQDSLWKKLITLRNTESFDEELKPDRFSSIKHWYFYQKNHAFKKIPSKIIPENHTYNFAKVVLAGKYGIGKTQIMNYLSEQPFSTTEKPTIGVEFSVHVYLYHRKYFKFQLWDTAGQERYRAITSAYYRGAAVDILVYSIADRDSFELEKWYNEKIQNADPQTAMIVVGNQCDQEAERVVSYAEGKEWAEKHNAAFVEVSAKTGKGFRTLEALLLKILQASTLKQEQTQ